MGVKLYYYKEGEPLPAFKEPALRKQEIGRLVGVLLRRRPDLAADPTQLTAPPPINRHLLLSGYGPYGDNFDLLTWNHLASDVVPTETEILEAITAFPGNGI